MIKIIKGKLVNNKIKTSKSLSWIKANIKMKEIIIIRGVFEKDKIISIRNKVFQFGKKFKEKNPKRNVNTNAYHRIDNNHKLMRVKRIAHFYRFSYKSDAKTNIFDVITPLNILRNKIANLKSGYSFHNEEDGYVSQPAALHYPTGGGYMETHIDPLKPQTVEMVLAGSQKGKDFSSGGLLVKSKKGNWVNVEKNIKIGDIVMFRPDVPHKVKLIDKNKKLNWKNELGRWTFFSPIASFKNQKLNEKSLN